MKPTKRNPQPVDLEEVAVAIRYLFGHQGEAPKVLASGRGHIARQILEIAGQHGVPVSERPELAETLARVPVGVEIPPELWEAMAEVLAHLFSIDGQRRGF